MKPNFSFHFLFCLFLFHQKRIKFSVPHLCPKNPFIIIMDWGRKGLLLNTHMLKMLNRIIMLFCRLQFSSVRETLYPNIHTSPFHKRLRRTFQRCFILFQSIPNWYRFNYNYEDFLKPFMRAKLWKFHNFFVNIYLI